MGPKYEFTGETKIVDGHSVHRIRRISNGELGGWIGDEYNLSQEWNCWVGDEAVVWNSEVYEDAVVDGHAYVHWTEGNGIFGKAHIYGNANITGVIKINGNAKVYGNAEIWYADIYDDVEVFGTAVIGYANNQEEEEELSGNCIELHGNAKIGCGTISQNIDKDTPPSVYNNNIKTITSYQRDAIYYIYSIKNFLLDLIDSGLFTANNDVSLVTLLFVGEDKYDKKEQKTYDYNEFYIKSKDNNINIILNKLYDGDDLYVTCTIKVKNIKTESTIENSNDFFNHIQWLHDTLMDMNYDEHYIRLLEL